MRGRENILEKYKSSRLKHSLLIVGVDLMELLDKIRIACLAIIVFLFAANTLDISLDFIPGIVKGVVFGFLIVFGLFFRMQRIGEAGNAVSKTLKGKKRKGN